MSDTHAAFRAFGVPTEKQKKLLLLVFIALSIRNRYGSWGICFTHGTWSAVRGLVAAGRTFKNCHAIRKACDFLLSKETPSGGWGESYLSCRDKVHSFLPSS